MVELSPRVQAARNVVARRPVVMKNPFGEAIAASASSFVDLMFQKRRLDLQRESLDERKRRNQVIEDMTALQRDLQRFEAITDMADIGVPLAEQTPLVQQTYAETWGIDPGRIQSDPSIANIIPRPPESVDQFKMTVTRGVLERLESRVQELQDAGSTRAANELQDQLNNMRESLALGQTGEEIELAAETSTRTHQVIDSVFSRYGTEEATPEDNRFIFNLAAENAGVPKQIEVVGPGGQTLVVDEPIASTLTSQWWASATDNSKNTRDRIDTLASSLTATAEKVGLAIPGTLAREIATAHLTGDQQALSNLARRSPEAKSAVELSLKGRRMVSGMADVYIESLPAPVANAVRRSIGQLQMMRESGLERSEILKAAKEQTNLIRAVAERHNIDPESLPGITDPANLMGIGLGSAMGGTAGFILGGPIGTAIGAGVGGFLGNQFGSDIEFQAGTAQDATAVQGQEAESTDQESLNLTPTQQKLLEAADRIEEGESEIKVQEEMSLTRQELLKVRRILRGGR